MLSKNRKTASLVGVQGEMWEGRERRGQRWQAGPGQAGLVEVVHLYPKSCGKPFLGSRLGWGHHLDLMRSAQRKQAACSPGWSRKGTRRLRIIFVATSAPQGKGLSHNFKKSFHFWLAGPCFFYCLLTHSADVYGQPVLGARQTVLSLSRYGSRMVAWCLVHGLQTSVKGQMINILGFVSHRLS